VADCPDLYPYALVVEWVAVDPFTYPPIPDALGAMVKEVVPDTEDWQFSVLRERENRVKFRFRDAAKRDTARAKIEASGDFAFYPRQIASLNPPDRAQRGIA